MTDISDFTVKAGDWRAQLRRNNRRTTAVIVVFVLFYVAIGLLIDMYLYDSALNAYAYQGYGAVQPMVPLSKILIGLLTFQLTPKATLITLSVALISLWVTYTFYDKIMLLGTDSREITPETAKSPEEIQLCHVVEELKVAAGLRFIPKIYIVEADYMNAFASGYSEKTALVAITRGLLQKLDRSELQAVMAHELSHIRHGDIKLTLTAAILSNLLLIAIDLIFYNVVFGRDRRADPRLVLAITILRFVLPITTLLLTLYLSRTREYMADAGCVELMRDNVPLARALLKISQDHEANAEHYSQEYNATAHEDVRRAAYLYDPVQSGIETVKSFANLFSTHPSIEARLKALGFKPNK